MCANCRICWAYFASSTEEVVQNRELREEMEETMGELFDTFKGFIPNGRIPEGMNVEVECIRLTLDPIKSEHRPLAFYFVPPTNSQLTRRWYIFYKALRQCYSGLMAIHIIQTMGSDIGTTNPPPPLPPPSHPSS
jgi:hypothetical protein